MGIGRICARKARNEGPGVPTAEFTVETADDSMILIRDVGRGKSVTNDAENVVAQMVTTYGTGRRLFYRDTTGRVDELLIDERGRFAGFKAGPAEMNAAEARS